MTHSPETLTSYFLVLLAFVARSVKKDDEIERLILWEVRNLERFFLTLSWSIVPCTDTSNVHGITLFASNGIARPDGTLGVSLLAYMVPAESKFLADEFNQLWSTQDEYLDGAGRGVGDHISCFFFLSVNLYFQFSVTNAKQMARKWRTRNAS